MNYKQLVITAAIILLMCSTASAWLSGYDHRMQIDINNTGNNLTDYQYSFTLNTATLVSAGKMNANGSDCRITNATDVLQSFWNETAFNDSSTKIWVNASSLGNITNTTHYFYYGESGASSAVDGDGTFPFFDNFDPIEENVFSVSKTLVTSSGLGQQEHNTMNYIDTALWSYNGSQYVTYVKNDGHVYVGKRALPNGAWSVYDTGGTVSDTADPHCSASLGIDADGYLHVSYGMHTELLRYRNSTSPEDPSSWSAGTMTGDNETSITYPRFFMTNDTLFFTYRNGTWLDGDQCLNVYNNTTKSWAKLHHLWIDGGGKGTYLDNVVTDANGVLHTSFQWRLQSGSIISAGNYTYAYSDDLGTTWKMENGTAYNIPITRSEAQCFLCEEDGSRINQQGIDVDSNGYPHVAFWKNGTWTDSNGKHHLNYWHAHYNGTGWTIQQLTNYTNTPTSGVYTYCEKDFSRTNCLINRSNNRVYVFGRIKEDGYIRVSWADSPYTSWTEKKLGNDTWGWQEFSTLDRGEWHTNQTFYMMATDADDVNPANVYVLKSDLAATENMKTARVQWTYGGTASTSTTQRRSYPNSMFLPPGTGSPTAYIEYQHTLPSSGTIAFDKWIYLNGTDQKQPIFTFSSSSGASGNWVGPHIYAGNNSAPYGSRLTWYDGSWHDTGYDIPIDQWVYLSAVVDLSNDTCDLLINDVLRIDNAPYISVMAGGSSPYNTVFQWSGNIGNGIYIDDTYIRNHNVPEPISSLGAEEDNPVNEIVLAANKYGLLRKNVISAETFSTIAAGFAHDVCFTWWNSTSDSWESYWVGDSYNSGVSVPQNDSYFVLMDGTGETVECSIAAAGTVAIPVSWSCTYLRENVSKTLTAIKSDMGGNVTDLYAWNHTATGTGAWTDTGAYSVLSNQGLLVNASAGFNWDGAVP